MHLKHQQLAQLLNCLMTQKINKPPLLCLACKLKERRFSGLDIHWLTGTLEKLNQKVEDVTMVRAQHVMHMVRVSYCVRNISALWWLVDINRSRGK